MVFRPLLDAGLLNSGTPTNDGRALAEALAGAPPSDGAIADVPKAETCRWRVLVVIAPGFAPLIKLQETKSASSAVEVAVVPDDALLTALPHARSSDSKSKSVGAANLAEADV